MENYSSISEEDAGFTFCMCKVFILINEVMTLKLECLE